MTDEIRTLARELAEPIHPNVDGAEWMNTAQRLAELVLAETPDPRWPNASPAFLAEYPWCGWVTAFGADSDTDTTAFGLERLVGLNILLTTADGRSRSVSMVEHRALSPVDGETGGIFFRELDTTHYEPLDPNGLEFAAFADIREIVIY